MNYDNRVAGIPAMRIFSNNEAADSGSRQKQNEQMKKEQREQKNNIRGSILPVLLDMGEALLGSGAEIYRAEDTLNRMGYAYGAAAMNVFVIPSSIVITMEMPDGEMLTQTRRVRTANANDFTRLDEINELSRDYCRSPFPVEELQERLRKITGQKVSRMELLVGFMIAAGAFAVFFGGTAQDGVISALGGLLIWGLQVYFAPICMNDTVYTFLASFLMGLLVSAAGRIFPGLHVDQVMIGDIMLLIPGIMITNAIRDFLLGDTISGALRLSQAVLLAGILVLGVMSALGIARWM